MKRKLLGSIVGLIVLIIFLEVSIRASSFIFSFYQNKRNYSRLKEGGSKKTITIVTVGESTTAVAANEKNTLLVQETAYPNYLEIYLNENQSKYHFVVINKGVMGGDTSGIVFDLKNYLTDHKPNMIVAMMGMKDIQRSALKEKARNNYRIDIDRFFRNLRVYNFLCLAYNQYVLNRSSVDDTKVVSRYEQLASEFLKGENERDVYMNISNHFGTDEINTEKLKTVVKEHLLTNYFLRTGQFIKARNIISRTISQTGFGFFLLADISIRENDLKGAEKILKEYMEKHPANPNVYKKLMFLYINDKNLSEAEKVFQKAVANKLELSLPLLVAKSQLEKEKGHYDKGIFQLQNKCGIKSPVYFKKTKVDKYSKGEIDLYASKMNYEECLYFLSELYYLTKRYDNAEKNLDFFRQINRKAYAAIDLLRRVYEDEGKTDAVADLLEKTTERSNRLGESFALANFYKQSNRLSEMRNVFESSKKDFPTTARNFQELYRISKESGAKLVLMQYPTFTLEFLKYFTGNLKDIYYVSNETIFNDAPKTKYFFEPRYPYKFNHYTITGAQVIARHLALEIEKGLKDGSL